MGMATEMLVIRNSNQPRPGAPRAWLLAAVWLFAWSPSIAQTVWVDDDCVPPGGGTQGDPYCTIQEAICSIKDSGGGTVMVNPGYYNESLRMFTGVSVVSTDGPAVTTVAADGKPCITSACVESMVNLTCSTVVFGSGPTPADRLEGFTMKKFTAVLAALVLVIGCGGSSGGTTAVPHDPVLAQLAEDLLEGCGSDNLEDLLDILERLGSLLESQGPFPEFSLTGVDLDSATILWMLDLDNDQQPDIDGSMGFVDSTGAATIPPIDLSSLQGGLDGLAALLTGLPDGTGVDVHFVPVLFPPQIDGNIRVTFQGGQPDTVDGNASIFDDLGCMLALELESEDALSILGSFPSGTLRITVTGAGGSLDGTITFNGTSTATLNVAVNGEGSYRFEINLLTGVVTEIR